MISEFHQRDYQITLTREGREEEIGEYALLKVHEGGVIELVRIDDDGENGEHEFTVLGPGTTVRVRRRR